MKHRKLLVLEINEITWDLIDPLIAAGKLPTFAHLKREGTWGTTLSVDQGAQLDPWVTWTTVYTGRPQSEHNVFFLQQPPESITAKRVWELCADAGVSVGVYGSVCSWPPRQVDGFYVPDTFAPDTRTYPESLSPIQQLNLTYTRSIRLPSDQDGLVFKAQLARRLLSLGLKFSTIQAIVSQLVAERLDAGVRWKRVALQPLVNFDFFSKLYRQHRPLLATFHTNHVAHYQHTYWKAMQPEAFKPLETTERECKTYGGAIEHGYRTADALLARVLDLIDAETVLMVASSMGQKPFRAPHLEGGKEIRQWRSLPALLDILGVRSTATAVSTMSDEFAIYTSSPEEAERIAGMLRAAYIDEPERRLFYASALENSVRVNLAVYSVGVIKPNSQLHFPTAPGKPVKSYDAMVYNTGHLKSGCHDERGMLMFYGAGIPKGLELPRQTTLNLAPTMMDILGLSIPAVMKEPPIAEISGVNVKRPMTAPAVR